jgi:hypothetical protein
MIGFALLGGIVVAILIVLGINVVSKYFDKTSTKKEEDK